MSLNTLPTIVLLIISLAACDNNSNSGEPQTLYEFLEQDFRNLLPEYLVYYNHGRPHQSLGVFFLLNSLKNHPRSS